MDKKAEIIMKSSIEAININMTIKWKNSPIKLINQKKQSLMESIKNILLTLIMNKINPLTKI